MSHGCSHSNAEHESGASLNEGTYTQDATPPIIYNQKGFICLRIVYK